MIITKITREQILDSIDQAKRAHSSYSCENCWIHYLSRKIGAYDGAYPCSTTQDYLNKQYHTGYLITWGRCRFSGDNLFPTKQILCKLTRTTKI